MTPPPDAFSAFWSERHLGVLATPRPAGGVHQIPVGVTLDAGQRVARVITHVDSVKVRNIIKAGPDAPVSVCQVDGARWSALEGTATVNRDPAAVADAERRYAARYRTPRLNPDRVVIEIAVTRFLGSVKPV